MHPVKNKIFQPFGQKWIADKDFILNGLQVKKGDDVYLKFFNLIAHNGLDYQAVLGEPIVAAFDGYIIEQVKKSSGYGTRISQRFEIDGKFYMAVYGHLQRLEKDIDIPWNWVEKSYPVTEGQLIGYVNSTGFSSGNHLHFGVYATNSNGGYLAPLNGYGGNVDPLPLILNNMSNSYLIQLNKKDGTKEFAVALPAVNESALIDKALNTGVTIPTLNNGQDIDWPNVVPKYIINEP